MDNLRLLQNRIHWQKDYSLDVYDLPLCIIISDIYFLRIYHVYFYIPSLMSRFVNVIVDGNTKLQLKIKFIQIIDTEPSFPFRLSRGTHHAIC